MFSKVFAFAVFFRNELSNCSQSTQFTGFVCMDIYMFATLYSVYKCCSPLHMYTRLICTRNAVYTCMLSLYTSCTAQVVCQITFCVIMFYPVGLPGKCWSFRVLRNVWNTGTDLQSASESRADLLMAEVWTGGICLVQYMSTSRSNPLQY